MSRLFIFIISLSPTWNGLLFHLWLFYFIFSYPVKSWRQFRHPLLRYAHFTSPATQHRALTTHVNLKKPREQQCHWRQTLSIRSGAGFGYFLALFQHFLMVLGITHPTGSPVEITFCFSCQTQKSSSWHIHIIRLIRVTWKYFTASIL